MIRHVFIEYEEEDLITSTNCCDCWPKAPIYPWTILAEDRQEAKLWGKICDRLEKEILGKG